MDEDAMLAIGTVLAALGGILERNGICTAHELAETLGGVAYATQQAGDDYTGRAGYVGTWAHMVRAAALGADRANPN